MLVLRHFSAVNASITYMITEITSAAITASLEKRIDWPEVSFSGSLFFPFPAGFPKIK